MELDNQGKAQNSELFYTDSIGKRSSLKNTINIGVLRGTGCARVCHYNGKENLNPISLLQKCPLFLERVVNELYFAVANMAISKITNKN